MHGDVIISTEWQKPRTTANINNERNIPAIEMIFFYNACYASSFVTRSINRLDLEILNITIKIEIFVITIE